MMMMSNIKVIVVFLDGGPYDTLSHLIRQNVLPNFRGLVEKGSFGVLHSTVPPISAVAVSSMVTGKNPGKHGVFGFGRFKNRILIPHTSSSLKGEAIWDLLSVEGKKVITLNVPLTFPPYKLNGIMVSGPPSPRNKVESYPPEIISLL